MIYERYSTHSPGWLAVFLVMASLVFGLMAWSADGVASTNTYCPVTTDEKVDQNFWLDYQGRRIYFCCRKCKAEFASNPEPYLANLTQPPQRRPTHTHRCHTIVPGLPHGWSIALLPRGTWPASA